MAMNMLTYDVLPLGQAGDLVATKRLNAIAERKRKEREAGAVEVARLLDDAGRRLLDDVERRRVLHDDRPDDAGRLALSLRIEAASVRERFPSLVADDDEAIRAILDRLLLAGLDMKGRMNLVPLARIHSVRPGGPDALGVMAVRLPGSVRIAGTALPVPLPIAVALLAGRVTRFEGPVAAERAAGPSAGAIATPPAAAASTAGVSALERPSDYETITFDLAAKLRARRDAPQMRTRLVAWPTRSAYVSREGTFPWSFAELLAGTPGVAKLLDDAVEFLNGHAEAFADPVFGTRYFTANATLRGLAVGPVRLTSPRDVLDALAMARVPTTWAADRAATFRATLERLRASAGTTLPELCRDHLTVTSSATALMTAAEEIEAEIEDDKKKSVKVKGKVVGAGTWCTSRMQAACPRGADWVIVTADTHVTGTRAQFDGSLAEVTAAHPWDDTPTVDTEKKPSRYVNSITYTCGVVLWAPGAVRPATDADRLEFDPSNAGLQKCAVELQPGTGLVFGGSFLIESLLALYEYEDLEEKPQRGREVLVQLPKGYAELLAEPDGATNHAKKEKFGRAKAASEQVEKNLAYLSRMAAALHITREQVVTLLADPAVRGLLDEVAPPMPGKRAPPPQATRLSLDGALLFEACFAVSPTGAPSTLHAYRSAHSAIRTGVGDQVVPTLNLPAGLPDILGDADRFRPALESLRVRYRPIDQRAAAVVRLGSGRGAEAPAQTEITSLGAEPIVDLVTLFWNPPAADATPLALYETAVPSAFLPLP